MAEKDEKPKKTSYKEEMYDRGKDKKEPAAKKEAGAEPEAAHDKPLNAGAVLDRHAEEREGLRKAHEAERRDEHTRQRDEHRGMNARHETEHEGVGEHAAKVALHRRHEHEKHELREEHHKRHRDMADRHHNERHTLHMKHEAELLGAEGAAPAQEPEKEAV